MNAPVIWIFLPAGIAVLLLFLQRWPRLSATLGVLLAIVLSSLAIWLKINQTIVFWRWSFVISDTFSIFGRRFVLEDGNRPALLMIYMVTAFWLGGALTAKAGRLAIPLGIGVVALLTAAFAVDPFLYAALLIEMAVLTSVPLLIQPGQPVGRGILRFLVYQTLGMMLLLFSGWLVEKVDVNPQNFILSGQAAIFIGLGFALLLAVIPFYTWIPMLAEEAHPYAVGLIFLMLPEMIMLFGLSFLDRYTWLREATLLYTILRVAGVGSIFIGGWMAASQQHLGRMLGFTVIVEIGYSLLSIGTSGGLPLHFALLLPRALSFGVYTLALSVIISRTGGLYIRQVRGIARTMPVAAAGVILSQFTLAGFPLLSGFPVHLALLETLGKQNAGAAMWALLGSAGLIVAGLRMIASLFTYPDHSSWHVRENRIELLFLGIGILALLVTGIFSQLYFPALTGLAQGLEYIAP